MKAIQIVWEDEKAILRTWGVIAMAWFLCLGGRATAAEGEALTARDVAWKAKNRPGYQEDESTALKMRLTNREGKVREREFVRYQNKDENGKRTLMKLTYPNEIRDTGTLNAEQPEGDDVQHLYLSALRKLRRVSAKGDSWMGSDFSYEDLMETKPDNFNYGELRTEMLDGHECYVYEKTPKSSGDSIYSKQVDWVRKEGFLPVKTLFFDKHGKELKVTEYTDMRPTNVPGVTYAWRIACRNLQDGHHTEMLRQWLFLDSKMDPEYTTTKILEKSVNTYNHPPNMWEIWETAKQNETLGKAAGGKKAGERS